MNNISQAQLLSIFPFAKNRIPIFYTPLLEAMAEFEIDTPMRVQMFLAQIGHESGELRYVRELASGEAYEGRKSLGNLLSGDGKRYKGRGLIQITGRANYMALQDALDLPCVDHPELIETPVNACRSAAWFWRSNGLNALADSGNFLAVTKKINGGTNGLPSRELYYKRAKEVIT